MKCSINYSLVLGCLSALLFSSCRIMYKPNMQNVPLFKEKGEVRATASTNNAQIAFAPTDHMGVMVNGYYNTNNWEVSTSSYEQNYDATRFNIEGALGYFAPINAGDESLFGIYAGGGIGNVTFDFIEVETSTGIETDQNKYDADLTRFFIQPHVGFTNNDIDFAFSTRLVGMSFRNISIQNYTEVELRDNDLYNLQDPFYFFLEPAVTFRAGHKWLKFHVQALYSMKLNPDPLNYRNFNLNAGIHLNLAPRFKKKEAPSEGIPSRHFEGSGS